MAACFDDAIRLYSHMTNKLISTLFHFDEITNKSENSLCELHIYIEQSFYDRA